VIEYTGSNFVGYKKVYISLCVSFIPLEKCETIIIASTMEVEFVACFNATFQANWLQNFISGHGVWLTLLSSH